MQPGVGLRYPEIPMRFAILAAGSAVCFIAAFGFITFASAGEFFETGGIAIRGTDPVAYFKEGRAVKGLEGFTATHKGSVFRFASAANRDAFAAAPERYAPQYGGFCAYAVAMGYKASIDPDAFTIVDGKLYLNFNKPTEVLWRKDIPGYIKKGDANWPVVSKKPNP
jgi:YHS domain-containing protein